MALASQQELQTRKPLSISANEDLMKKEPLQVPSPSWMSFCLSWAKSNISCVFVIATVLSSRCATGLVFVEVCPCCNIPTSSQFPTHQSRPSHIWISSCTDFSNFPSSHTYRAVISSRGSWLGELQWPTIMWVSEKLCSRWIWASFLIFN
jgi:hypothetical protein